MLSIEILPKSAAEARPVGKARKEPNMYPFLPPPSGRIKWVRATGVEFTVPSPTLAQPRYMHAIRSLILREPQLSPSCHPPPPLPDTAPSLGKRTLRCIVLPCFAHALCLSFIAPAPSPPSSLVASPHPTSPCLIWRLRSSCSLRSSTRYVSPQPACSWLLKSVHRNSPSDVACERLCIAVGRTGTF
jgi:hypothetical protein